MKDSDADPRQKAILIAAWKSFAAYGYRKTSMDDIARGAGMSRPALYLHYRNKEDIFRSLVLYYHDQSNAAVQKALTEPGPVTRVLTAAFAAQGGDVIEAMLTSPHGMELLDTGTVLAGDIVAQSQVQLRELYADWLTDQARLRRIRLSASADEVAGTMTAALKGIKMSGDDYATYRSRVALLAGMIAAGLEAKEG
jgi:AcrR family transcriptional regulator